MRSWLGKLNFAELVLVSPTGYKCVFPSCLYYMGLVFHRIGILLFLLSRKKPDWAKTGPKLKATGKEAKADLQTPITNIKEVAEGDDKLAWKKPDWASSGPKLKSTAKGQKLKVSPCS